MYSLEQKDKRFILHLFLTTILGGVIGVLNYFFNILVARYTTSSIFGIFSAALGIIYLSQIAGVAIQSLITKTVAKNRSNNLEKYKWYSLLVFTLLGLAVALLFYLFKKEISNVSSIPEGLMFYLALAIFTSFISPISKGLLLGIERIITVNLLLLLETIFRFVIGIIAIRMGGNLPVLVIANIMPPVLTTLFLIPLLKLNSTGAEDIKNNWKEFSLMTVAFILLTMPFTMDLVLVNSNFKAEYSALALLGKLVYFACITTSAVMFARLSNESDLKIQKRYLLTTSVLSLTIGLFLSLSFLLLGRTIISLSVGNQYLDIYGYLFAFGICMTGYSIVYMLANYFISRSTYSYLVILFLTTVLQIVLFSVRNDTLLNVVQNQVILYTTLTLTTLLFLFLNFKKQKDGRKEKFQNKN